MEYLSNNQLPVLYDASNRPMVPTAVSSIFGSIGAYEGASSRTVSGKNWQPALQSAAADLLPDREALIARCRDLSRNNGIASSIIGSLVDSVIGAGLRPHPQIKRRKRELLKLSPQAAEDIEAQLLDIWDLCADSVDFDVSRTHNLYLKQRMVFREYLEAGDCLCFLPAFPRLPFPFLTKFQAVESERVENPNYQIDTEKLIAGVERDTRGAVAGYHYRTDSGVSPFSTATQKWSRVAAFGSETGRRTAWLVHDGARINQIRGVPYLANVMADIREAGQYKRAELLASIVSGNLALFIKSPTGTVHPFAQLAAQQAASVGPVSPAGAQDLTLDYASILSLKPGEEITPVHMARPNSQFGPFLDAVMSLICAGVGLPREIVLKKFEASYSASRGAIQEAGKRIRVMRAFAGSEICQPIYEAIVTEAVLRGFISLPGFIENPLARKAYLACIWRGPTQPSLDPLKEVKAARERIAAGISTIEREVVEDSGEAWEDLHEQSVREKKARLEDGLEVEPVEPGADDPGLLEGN